jgi:hypothetical protein
VPAKSHPVHIVVDTREQYPFDLRGHDDVIYSQATLKTGDYSVFGLESVITVERKRNPAEIAGNLFKDRERFERELDRMRDFQECHIVLCFSLSDLLAYPYDKPSSLPAYVRKKIRLSGKALLKRMLELQRTYPYIQWWFTTNEKQAADLTLAILKAADRLYEKSPVLEQGGGFLESSVESQV